MAKVSPPLIKILLIAWSLWKERNNWTFSRTVAGQHELFRKVLREAED
jgi:hypothetical protein